MAQSDNTTFNFQLNKPNSSELKNFLINTGFKNRIPLDEYINKVLKYADFITLLSGNQIVGLSILYANRPEQNFAYITYIALYPNFRGKGLGKKLLLFSCSFAQKKGYSIMRLEVDKNNLTAYKLYVSSGFLEYSMNQNSFYLEKNLRNGN